MQHSTWTRWCLRDRTANAAAFTPSPPQTPVEQPGSCYTYALKCWPECPRDDIKWNLSLPVLEHYSESIASFAVDANATGERQFTNRTQLLADRHHPTDAGHAMIAEAVLLHLRSRAAAKPYSQDGPPPSLPQACCLAAIDEASGSAFAASRGTAY